MLEWACDVQSAQPSLVMLAKRYGNQCTTFINTLRAALVQVPASLRALWELFYTVGEDGRRARQERMLQPAESRCMQSIVAGDRMVTRGWEPQGCVLLGS